MKVGIQSRFSFIEPMNALPVENLPEGDWLYEIKFDGYRALAFKDGKDVRLISRDKKAFDYPQLLDAIKKLPAERVILDGEIAALDEKGRSSFQLLQIESTKAVNGAAAGSNSKSSNLRSSSSAVAHCLREAAKTSDPCLLATTVPTDSCSPAESGAAFPRNSWRASTHSCKGSGAPLARLSTCQRNHAADGA